MDWVMWRWEVPILACVQVIGVEEGSAKNPINEMRHILAWFQLAFVKKYHFRHINFLLFSDILNMFVIRVILILHYFQHISHVSDFISSMQLRHLVSMETK